MAADGPKWHFTKVFGREDESERLLNAKNGLVVLHGKAGSGKSSIVQSQPWESRGCVLASGKFETHQSPFSGVIQALNDLVDQWANDNATSEEERGG